MTAPQKQVKKVRYKKLYIKLFYLHQISRKGKLVVAYGWGEGGGPRGRQRVNCKKPRELLGGGRYYPTVQWWWLHCSTKSLSHRTVHLSQGNFMVYTLYISKNAFKIQCTMSSVGMHIGGNSYSENHRLQLLIFNKHKLPLIAGILLWESKHSHPRTCCPTGLPATGATVYSCAVPDLSQPPTCISLCIWWDWGPRFEFSWHLSEVEWPHVAHGYPTAQLSSTSLSLFSPKPEEPEGVT